MLAATESLADFSRWCAPPMIANTIRLTHPPHDSRSDARECQPQQVQTGQVMCYLPRSFDQAERGLRHELVYVVVVAILHAWVDTATPRGPLPIADPALSEANHPATIGIDAIAEVEVLYLYLLLASHYSSNDVFVLADGGKRGIILDPAQHVGYTALDHRDTSDGPGLGVLVAPPGPSLYSTSIFYHKFTIKV